MRKYDADDTTLQSLHVTNMDKYVQRLRYISSGGSRDGPRTTAATRESLSRLANLGDYTSFKDIKSFDT